MVRIFWEGRMNRNRDVSSSHHFHFLWSNGSLDWERHNQRPPKALGFQIPADQLQASVASTP